MPRLTSSRRLLPSWLAALLAGLIGASIPVQSRLNGELGVTLGDPVMAAAVSFVGGLLIMLMLALTLPTVRRGLASLPRAVATRAIPPYYLAAGTVGAFLVFTQSTVVAVVGVAVFTVAVVAGQVISGIVIDTVGFAQSVRRPAGGARLLGAGLVLVAVVLSASSSFRGGGPFLQMAGPALLALAAGSLTGFQHAINGRVGSVAGSPLVATATNFIAGTTLLGAVLAVRALLGTAQWSWPTEWWLYSGGIFGFAFIAGSAALIPHAGVLVVGLGSVAGQLVASLLLDVVAPVGDTGVDLLMVLGTLLALVALSITTLAGRRR
ncbi:DMT family transporter [Georgenia sunbinii]|uniref:DMT family transporter n=1 Tax=Georgenia sunbinii TaxID=3117728 RepID=UPI002F266221